MPSIYYKYNETFDLETELYKYTQNTTLYSNTDIEDDETSLGVFSVILLVIISLALLSLIFVTIYIFGSIISDICYYNEENEELITNPKTLKLNYKLLDLSRFFEKPKDDTLLDHDCCICLDNNDLESSG